MTTSVDISFLKDDIYVSLKAGLLVSGKGRPPNTPSVDSNKKLLLQLHLLREESGSLLSDYHKWMSRLFPHTPFDSTKLKNDIVYTYQKFCKLPQDTVTSRLFILEQYNHNFICKALDDVGIDRAVLLAPLEDFKTGIAINSITNEVVVSIETFKNITKTLRSDFTYKWIYHISSVQCDSLPQKLKSTLKLYNQLLRYKSRRPEEFNSFLKSPFFNIEHHQFLQTPDVVLTSSSEPTNIHRLTQSTQTDTRYINTHTQTHVIRRKETSTQTDVTKDRKKITELKEEIGRLYHEINDIKDTRIYEKNRKLKLELEEATSSLVKHQADLCSSAAILLEKECEIESLKKDKLAKSKLISRLKLEKEQLRGDIEEQVKVIKDLQDINQESKVETRAPHKNAFTDDIRRTVMSLEASGVAAAKCPQVIDIVSRTLFNQILDLPHPTTANNFVEEAHALTKFHVAECVKENTNITLHSDGTSRDKRKYVGRQLTLDDGTIMSLGFNEVATEDAQTLVEDTVDMLEELCDIHEDTDGDAEFLHFLGSIKSTMNDRASVMKSFNNKFADLRKQVLGKDVTTNFLYCNAHLLLGLSTSCEDAVREIEAEMIKESGEVLGRDKCTVFGGWLNGAESASLRYIRTAASCMGTRGDEKSGVREEWLVFCEKEQVKSKIISHRNNRFNNIFQNAEAILILTPYIQMFLQNSVGLRNKLLQSILLDSEDVRILVALCALALLNIHVTGPYWKMVNSNVQYLEVPGLVQKMISNLSAWKEEPSRLLDNGCEGVFHGDFWDVVVTQYAQVLKFAVDHWLEVSKVIVRCLDKMIVITKRQLEEFVGDGRYAGDVGPKLKEELKNRPKTNLAGEHAFGDLDFDINSRRNCSLFNRSTKQMVKRNKTMDWLEMKGSAERQKLMAESRKVGKKLRRKYKEQERIVRLKIKEKLLENERKKRERELKAMAEKQMVIDQVMADGGICETRKQVEKLKNVASLKAQLKYHKVVLGVSDLQVGGKKEQLQHRLIVYLEEGKKIKGPLSSPPKKKRRVEGQSESVSDSEDESEASDTDSSLEDEDIRQEVASTFEFSKQGMWVAVFYDQMFYVGQVIEYDKPDTAIVKFMEETKSQPGHFKWPRIDDIAEVSSKYVFRWDFEVLPSSSNGRVWIIPDLQKIEKIYTRLKQD